MAMDPCSLFLLLLSNLIICSSASDPSTTPVTNPAAIPAIVTVPSTNPRPRWCVAKSGAAETSIQAALDYACGMGGADCSAIQQGGSCYSPVTLLNHASYAFNTYYQRNPVPASCDFAGAALITYTNPSFAYCVYATSTTVSPVIITPPATMSPAITPPTTVSPVIVNPPATLSPAITPPTTVSPVATYPTSAAPTTPSSTGTLPVGTGIPPIIFDKTANLGPILSILNGSNPELGGGFGDGAPVVNVSTSASCGRSLQPFILVVASLFAIMDV